MDIMDSVIGRVQGSNMETLEFDFLQNVNRGEFPIGNP